LKSAGANRAVARILEKREERDMGPPGGGRGDLLAPKTAAPRRWERLDVYMRGRKAVKSRLEEKRHAIVRAF